MTEDVVHRFFLEALDSTTECPDVRSGFAVTGKELSELCALLDADPLEIDARFYYLEADVVARLTQRFAIAFEPEEREVRLVPWNEHDALPYEVHTNRELALMLRGTKPLATFSERYPPNPDVEDIPERLFDPFVATGRFIKREYVIPSNRLGFVAVPGVQGVRCVLYALIGQEWRIDALILLEDAAYRSGWTETAVRLEGALLGYESWQNDAYIEQIWRPWRARMASDGY